ncbi:hypothetical protein GQF03_07660 [Sneathiella chungangensis]|uniref:Uncharacterized protein n=1 Tax=Sneathiella chungangensis TaxID=1418234 RepID=A0A845MEU6_9PROT|nr:hypothetical protein [Sneathiella chungangensis]MZR22201.1 hypothetical protein [Sneathiella chungangensis]
MLDRIINNIIEELTLKEDNVFFPRFSALRIGLSADAADYLVEKIFTPNQARQITENLNEAYENYRATFGDKKRSDAEQEDIKTAFIEDISHQIGNRTKKYVNLENFNFGIVQHANDVILVGDINQHKSMHRSESFKYICNNKSLAVYVLLLIIIVLSLVLLSKEIPILAAIIVFFSVICCGCVYFSNVAQSGNRWTNDILENQMRQVLLDDIFGPDFSYLGMRLKALPDQENMPDVSALDLIREAINIPGIAKLLMTLDPEFSRDLALLTAEFVYPPDLMPIFAASVGLQYIPRSSDHEITHPSDDDEHDSAEKKEEEPNLDTETPGNTDDAPLTGFTTAGMQLDITESDGDSEEKQGGGQVEINIDVTESD